MPDKKEMKKTAEKKSFKAILVPHTHWDREWYSPFQVFRTRLVKMMDKLLDILARDPKFTCFTMDGQVAPIEDYLEVRPERGQELRKLIAEGRIVIGPSYIQPDNFLVSGEAHIRNLLLGMKLAEQYGRVMKVGYMPDAFGQIAQMPQILSGCGINTAIFTRGVGDEGEDLKSEFTWRAPDGTTSVLTHWLVLHYANLKGVSTNMASASSYIAEVVDKLKNKATTRNVLLMNGNDHVEPQPHIPLVVENVNKSNSQVDVKIGTFSDYFDLVKAGKPPLKVFEGEFRGSKYESVLTGVTSTRNYLKQTNAEIEMLLERWVEPFDAWAWSLGQKPNHGLIWQAWKYTIQCHPHDSICGCGVDPIYHEMMTRFASAEQLATAVLKNDLCYISSRIKLDPKDYAIVVFNPLNWIRTDTVETSIFANKSTDSFEIIDPHGKPIPFNICGERKIGRGYSMLYKERVFDIAFLAENVPPCGYKTYRIRRLLQDEGKKEEAKVTDSESHPSDDIAIENEYFKVKVEEDGSVTLIDKTTETTYRGFNALQDGGDVGDEYNYDPPREDRLYSNKGLKAEVSLHRNNKTRSTIRVRYELALPTAATKDKKTRSDQLISCAVSYEVTVFPKVPRVDFKLQFDNNVKDHRLRTLFPTGINSDHGCADQAFHVIKRPIALPAGKDWHEPPAPTHAMQSFVSLSDGKKGVTLGTRGIMEYEAKHDGTIAITLLRCVGMLSQEQLSTRPTAGPLIPTPDAQCLGRHTFNYSVIAHAGTWESSKAYLQTMQHRVPMRTVQVVEHEFAVLREDAIIPGEFNEPVVKTAASPSASLPNELSFLSVEPSNILVSAVKRCEDGKGVVVRVFNTTTKTVEGRLRIHGNLKQAVPVNMREEPIEDNTTRISKIGDIDFREFSFESSPFHVNTFKLELNSIYPTKKTS